MDEACLEHGRTVDPLEWERAEAMERGYVMSGVSSTLRGAGLDLTDDVEELVMKLLGHADAAVSNELPEDDGHNYDRAIGRVADALAALYGRPETPSDEEEV